MDELLVDLLVNNINKEASNSNNQINNNKAKTNFQKVQEFNRAFDMAPKEPANYLSGYINEFGHFQIDEYQHIRPDIFNNSKIIRLRLDLIDEEIKELMHAIEINDFIETRDAIADILYVVYGMADVLGINIDMVCNQNIKNIEMSNSCNNKRNKMLTIIDYANKYSKLDTNGNPIGITNFELIKIFYDNDPHQLGNILLAKAGTDLDNTLLGNSGTGLDNTLLGNSGTGLGNTLLAKAGTDLDNTLLAKAGTDLDNIENYNIIPHHPLSLFKSISVSITNTYKELEIMCLAVDSKNVKIDTFKNIGDCIYNLLKYVYTYAYITAIDANADFAIVHTSNMSKLCDTEEDAQNTVADYESKFANGKSQYDSPYYYELPELSKWIVKNKNTGKALKNIKYQKVEFK